MKPLFALSLLSLLGCSCLGGKMPDGTPDRYEFRYSGPMMYPLEWYLVERADDGTLRILSSHGEADILIVRAPEDIFQQLDSLARQYRLNRLKEDYQPPFQVLDGNFWSFRLRYPDHQEISSGGYHAWPAKALREGINAINGRLREIVSAAKENDILGHDNHDNRRP